MPKFNWKELTTDNSSLPPYDVDVMVRGLDKEEMTVAYYDSYGWTPVGVRTGYDMASVDLDFTVLEWAFLDNTLEPCPLEARIAELEAELAKVGK